MVNTRKYKERVCFSFNTDRDLINKAQANAKKNGQTTSEYLTNLMREDLQKNEIGQKNPISIEYISPHAKKSDNNTLDTYLEKGFITRKQFIQQFKEKDLETLNKYEGLGRTISTCAMAVSQYKRTGKYPAL